MGVITFEKEVSTSNPPPKLFKAFVLDGDNLIPKIMPQAIKSVETLEGDGGAGTIKSITFGEGSKFKSVMHMIDEVDKENQAYKYTVIEGDALKGILDSISYVVKIEASDNGGSVCKTTSHYHVKDEADHGITEEKIKEGKEKAKTMFHATEAYLHAHTLIINYYNYQGSGFGVGV